MKNTALFLDGVSLLLIILQGRKDSNLRPLGLEPSALPTELRPYEPIYILAVLDFRVNTHFAF